MSGSHGVPLLLKVRLCAHAVIALHQAPNPLLRTQVASLKEAVGRADLKEHAVAALEHLQQALDGGGAALPRREALEQLCSLAERVVSHQASTPPRKPEDASTRILAQLATVRGASSLLKAVLSPLSHIQFHEHQY
jgi:hypothetical protein